MLLKSINNKIKLSGVVLASVMFSLPLQAYQHGSSGMYGDRAAGSGSGMGMGMGSGSGYHGRPGYGYQRPPRPPMNPYYYQRPPMPPVRSYGYPSAPVNNPATTSKPTEQKAPAADSITVSIQGMVFQPANLSVKTGATVTWVNNDSFPHTVTSSDSGPLASETLSPGSRYSVTFDQPGTYQYYCKYHPNMRASITVE